MRVYVYLYIFIHIYTYLYIFMHEQIFIELYPSISEGYSSSLQWNFLYRNLLFIIAYASISLNKIQR